MESSRCAGHLPQRRPASVDTVAYANVQAYPDEVELLTGICRMAYNKKAALLPRHN
jgi:hypothetical protein